MNRQNLIVSLPLVFEISGNIFTAIFCLPGCEFIHFESYLYHRAVFLHDQKVRTKTSRTKRTFKVK